MSTPTLDALYRAVVAQPEDHTVRLVYADALDETGEKADAVRAGFIRDQIQQLGLPETDALHIGLATRSRGMFAANWPLWWHPVCEASGWELPHIPNKGIWDRVSRALGRESAKPGWPYTLSPTEQMTINYPGGGLTVRFAAGFPEELRITTREADALPVGRVHHWGDAMPLVRLVFDRIVTPDEWQRIEGPHLARLPELVVEPLLDDLAMLLAASPHLAALTRLTIHPRSESPQMFPEIIRYVVHWPTWKGLRVLRIAGHLNPDAVRVLATACTLEHLEEVDLHLGNTGFFGAATQAMSVLIQQLLPAFNLGTPSPHWAEFGPSLQELAAAPWLKRLRCLRITTDSPQGLLGMMRLYGSAERGADLLPDVAVTALANAVNTDTLEKLVLPGTVIAPSVREELITRLGYRLVFE